MPKNVLIYSLLQRWDFPSNCQKVICELLQIRVSLSQRIVSHVALFTFTLSDLITSGMNDYVLQTSIRWSQLWPPVYMTLREKFCNIQHLTGRRENWYATHSRWWYINNPLNQYTVEKVITSRMGNRLHCVKKVVNGRKGTNLCLNNFLLRLKTRLQGKSTSWTLNNNTGCVVSCSNTLHNVFP